MPADRNCPQLQYRGGNRIKAAGYREVEQIACRGFDESEKALLWNLLERVYENLQEAAVEEDAHA